MAEERPPGPPGFEDETLPPSGARPAGAEGDLPRRFGRYTLERELGRGGMGVVYLARDEQLGRPVALKIPSIAGLKPDNLRARFLREARAAAALSHPNICAIYDSGEIDGSPYLTMPFVDGEPLSCRIDPKQPFAPDDAVAMTVKLALALHEAHEKGIAHRDLKPGNVMIDGRGEPLIMDFGLARHEDATNLTAEGEILGSPAYMSPEQVAGEVAAMGPACDVWALGVILYELLTGRPPWSGDTFGLMAQIATDDPRPPSARRPDLDPRFDRLCLKALEKSPANRWPSMRAFADALRGPAIADGPNFVLKVEGARLAYRPPSILPVVTVGRQKRKPGAAPDEGNDFVVRVPGDDRLSMRISRRHLEISRGAGGLLVTDRGKFGTLLNGEPLKPGTPTPLRHADRLTVAEVITLVVSTDDAATLSGPAVAGPHAAGRLILEATVGDMVTCE